MKKFLDFGFYKENFIPIAVLFLSILWAFLFNVSEILENTIYENISIIPLIVAIVYCLKMKKNKVVFRMLAMFFFLLIAREFSYGRVPFCAIENHPHDFYPWSHYKYGFLANIIVGIYVAIGILYGLINKFWLDIVDIFKKVVIPFWNFFFAIITVIAQHYFEHSVENSVAEEICEFTIYCLILTIVMIYAKKIDN